MSGSLFQNYMVPLRLLLSPADMAAIFINLEVRAPAPPTACGSGLRAAPLHRPQGPRELCPCQGLGRFRLESVFTLARWEESSPLLPLGTLD